MYFLSMKITDGNNQVPVMSESSADMSEIVDQFEMMYKLLTRRNAWDMPVIDNEFKAARMSDAAMGVINGDIVDFEWDFKDKYSRRVTCYVTYNV